MLTDHQAAKDASLGVGHIWTATRCPAYRSLQPDDCACQPDTFPWYVEAAPEGTAYAVGPYPSRAAAEDFRSRCFTGSYGTLTRTPDPSARKASQAQFLADHRATLRPRS